MSARPNFDDTYAAIDLAIQQIFVRWKVYGQLFDSGAENIDLFNSSGSYVFGLLQRLLLDDVMMALSRLTDPATTFGNPNASIEHLLQAAQPHLSAQAQREATDSLQRLKQHVSNIRVHRKKALAHSDLQHAVGNASLPGVSYAEIEGAMRELSALRLNLGSSSIHRVGGYAPIIQFGTDGVALLTRLRAADGATGG